MTTQYLTIGQAAEFCNMTYESFRYYIKNNRGAKHIQIADRKFFTEKDLKAWNPEDRRCTNKKAKV